MATTKRRVTENSRFRIALPNDSKGGIFPDSTYTNRRADGVNNPDESARTCQPLAEERTMYPKKIERDVNTISDRGRALCQDNPNLRMVEPPSAEPKRPRPDIRSLVAASWKQNEETYRKLSL